MLTKIITKFKSIKKILDEIINQTKYTPKYRVVAIQQSQEDYFEVTIQIINENKAFNMRPEEILANDTFVDCFSPRDVRTLTYLGYLEINGPKYTILAKRLSEAQDKTLFAIKKKGEKQVIVKSANEINNEKEILKNLDPNDAHIVGYIAANESILNEKNEMQRLLDISKKDSKNSD